MDSAMFVNITDVVSREADWPDVGFATGFRNSTMPSLIRWVAGMGVNRYRYYDECSLNSEYAKVEEPY